MSDVRVYAYAKCSTCKKAIKWLEAHDIRFESVPIVESPPSVEDLSEIQRMAQIEVKKLFNTSGQSYRSGGWKEKLPHMSEEAALAALAADGKMIKRPLVVGEDFALVGFNETHYCSAFNLPEDK